MKQLILPLIVSSLLIACDEDDGPGNCLNASGNTVEETRTVPAFTGISASIVGDIFITQGSPQELRITSHPSVLAELETTVDNNVLEIEIDRCVNNLERLDIFVIVPDLSLIDLAGVGNVVAQNDLDVDNLSASLSGVGNITLRGVADNFVYSSSGIGNLLAFNLTTSTASVSINGSGNAEITATNTLDVTISGIGNVFYRGNPTITSNISGSGNVIDSN